MNSQQLADWQIERLSQRVRAELHFLDKLEGRMHQKHFPQNDPVYDSVQKARAAEGELAVQLNRLRGPT